jgi:MFS family permease
MAEPPAPILTPPDESKARARPFTALRYRSFRFFWSGLVLSLMGGWMQQIASPWLVYRLTDSALMLGLVPFLAAVPAAPLSLVAGPVVDRMSRRTVLLATQLGLFVLSIGVAGLIWTGQVQIWQIIVTEFLRGAIMAFDQPAKQVAILEMTSKQDVGSAIALWSVAMNVAKIVGPVLAGLLIASTGDRTGVAWCFFLNGVSYLAVIAALVTMRLPAPQPDVSRATLAGSLVDGLKYLVRERLLLAIASLALVAGVFVRPFQTLMPVFADDVLQAGAKGLGFLTAAVGAGSLLGALGAASPHPRLQRPLLLSASVLLPFAAAGFAFSHSFLLSCVLLVAVGGLLTAVETLSNTLVTVGLHDEYRGRVMSLYSAAATGAPRLGGLGAGWLAARSGAPLALGLGAVACLVYSVPAVWLIAGKLRSQTLTTAAPEI